MTRKEAIKLAETYGKPLTEETEWVIDAIMEAAISWVIVKNDKYGFHYRCITGDGTFGWTYVKEIALQFKRKSDAEANCWNDEGEPVQVISI